MGGEFGRLGSSNGCLHPWSGWKSDRVVIGSGGPGAAKIGSVFTILFTVQVLVLIASQPRFVAEGT